MCEINLETLFFYAGQEYQTEQEIINAGEDIIFQYCLTYGRWIDIEHIVINHSYYGYAYAKYVLGGRFDSEIELLYLIKNNNTLFCNQYIFEFIEKNLDNT